VADCATNIYERPKICPQPVAVAAGALSVNTARFIGHGDNVIKGEHHESQDGCETSGARHR
jgi:hypothetical protein